MIQNGNSSVLTIFLWDIRSRAMDNSTLRLTVKRECCHFTSYSGIDPEIYSGTDKEGIPGRAYSTMLI